MLQVHTAATGPVPNRSQKPQMDPIWESSGVFNLQASYVQHSLHRYVRVTGDPVCDRKLWGESCENVPKYE